MACSPGRWEGGHDHGEDPNDDHDLAAEHAHVLHVEPELAEPWGLEVAMPGRTDVVAEVELPGVLATNENRTARVGPLVAGQIARVHVDLGQRVQAGQTLATLNAPEFNRAQTAFLRAFAQAELSRKDFERAVALRERQAIEDRELLRRRSLYEQDVAELTAAGLMLQSLGVEEGRLREISGALALAAPGEEPSGVEPLLPIHTPLGGVVLARDAVLGDHVDPGRVLFTVSDLGTLWAWLDAYEHQISSLSPDAEVVVRTPLLPGRDFPGRVTFISDQVDEELRTVRVRVEVPNPDGLLKPNMYIQGLLRVRGAGEDRIVVPPDAVILLDGHQVVFVERPPEPGESHRVFEAREVTPGELLTVGRVIVAGLDGSEQVVTEGAFTLKAELTKGAGGHDHVH
jgi:membrane fusion protein, heavy metal efflux system